MKKIITTGFLLLALIQVRAEGVTFSSEAWKQLVQQAKTSNKFIFVDFYATWCGPCKHLEKEIFTNAEVGKYFNDNFINKRIDAESEELELVGQMNIAAYPTLVFFDPKGEVLYRVEGAPDENELMGFARKVFDVSEMKTKGSWNESPEKFKTYLEALSSHEPAAAERMASEYLGKLPKEDLRKAENWALLSGNIKDAKDPAWQYVFANYAYFREQFNDLSSYLEVLSETAMQKAVTAKNPGLLSTKTEVDVLRGKVQGDSSVTREQFQLWNTVQYAEKIEDNNGYAAGLQAYLKKYSWNEPKALTYYASKILSGKYTAAANSNATRWAEQALSLDKENYATYWVLAIAYAKVNNVPKSNAALQNFVRLSKADAQLPEKIRALLSE